MIAPRGQVNFLKRLYEGTADSWVAAGRILVHPLMLDMNMHSKDKGNIHRTRSP